MKDGGMTGVTTQAAVIRKKGTPLIAVFKRLSSQQLQSKLSLRCLRLGEKDVNEPLRETVAWRSLQLVNGRQGLRRFLFFDFRGGVASRGGWRPHAGQTRRNSVNVVRPHGNPSDVDRGRL